MPRNSRLTPSTSLYPECPVCGYEGWLAYTATGRGSPWAEQPGEEESWRAYDYYFVEIELQACEFACGVCGLHLHSELLRLTYLDDHMRITGEANQKKSTRCNPTKLTGTSSWSITTAATTNSGSPSPVLGVVQPSASATPPRRGRILQRRPPLTRTPPKRIPLLLLLVVLSPQQPP